jgi:hypothetical protein
MSPLDGEARTVQGSRFRTAVASAKERPPAHAQDGRNRSGLPHARRSKQAGSFG